MSAALKLSSFPTAYDNSSDVMAPPPDLLLAAGLNGERFSQPQHTRSLAKARKALNPGLCQEEETARVTLLKDAQPKKGAEQNFYDPLREEHISALVSGASIRSVLQEWEARVVEINGETLFLALVDVRRPEDGENSEAEISITSINTEDRPYLAPGSLLRWMFGYEKDQSGQIKRFNALKLRRESRRFYSAEFKKADKRAVDWANALNAHRVTTENL